jgi:hypothetical protein
MKKPPLKRTLEHTADAAPSTPLQDLLDRIQAGTIEDVDELAPQDIELLRSYCRDEEDLEAVFDRLRGEGRDDR